MATARSLPRGTGSTGPTSRTSRERRPRTRRGLEPGRRALLLATGMVVLGSFMPWIDTAVGTISGARGAGLWTFYAAMLGLAGALVPWRRAAAVQGGVLAAAATALPIWQLLHLLTLVGIGGWVPGPGIVLVFGGGVLAPTAAWRLWRPLPAA
jgi:hypothetical protein